MIIAIPRSVVCALMLALSLSHLSAAGAGDRAYYDYGPYRIAVSHDGNHHDPDDIGAVPWQFAVLHEAGLTDRLVHVHHSNHLGKSGEQYRTMKAAVDEGARRFGVDSGIVFDCIADLEGAMRHLVSEINRSSAQDPLYICAAGPMETVYVALVNSDPAKRRFVTVISHSQWNNEHDDFSAVDGRERAHTWDDLQDLGANMQAILNQNGENHNDRWKVNNLAGFYGWLRSSPQSNENWVWLYEHLDANKDGDVSDAGMIWYVITGRGVEDGDGPLDARHLFEADLQRD